MSSPALIAAYALVNADEQPAIRQWEDDVQAQRLHAFEGVRQTAHLETLAGDPEHLLLCLTADESAATDDELLAACAVERAFPLSLGGWHRRGYRQLVEVADPAHGLLDTPGVVLSVKLDVAPDCDREFNHWYNEIHIPEVLACPGWLTARRYECLDGEPRYLALYNLEGPEALTTSEFQEVVGFGPFLEHVRTARFQTYARRPVGGKS